MRTLADWLAHQQAQHTRDIDLGLERVGAVAQRLGLLPYPIPAVIVGGELTLETLDLIYSETARFYEAPFQLKATNGMLLIDDFGRQKVGPKDLLNRWIVPLESEFDFLTMHTGKKLQVPFDVFVVFSTNLDPAALVDAGVALAACARDAALLPAA